jgi:mono/diheme cytochrome c family protein
MQEMPIAHRKQEIMSRVGWNCICHPGILFWFTLLLALVVTACASPEVSVPGPTPIPTLIPATMVPSQAEPTPETPLIGESFPAGIPAAAAGQALYAEHCVDCHGADGNGQVPNARNFGDVDYMRGETPLDFYLAITEGIPSVEDVEDEMPAFGDKLSSDERWDLVYFIWQFSTSTERLDVGEQMYTFFCEECHGPDGRSQTLDAADLGDQRFIAHQSPATLYLSVTRGRGSMPAWQARLSQDERWMVIEFLRTFSYDPHLNEEITLEGENAAEEDTSTCDPAYLSQTNPFDWGDPQAIAAGEPIYIRECAECHGEDGTGEIPQAPDFTNPVTRGELLETPGQGLCRVTEGLNRMPAYQDTLTETEMWQVLTYLASLGE